MTNKTGLSIKSSRTPEQEQRIDKIKKQMSNWDTVKYTINIPVKIHQKFKQKTVSQRKDMKEVLMDMILNYLEKEDGI